MPSTPRSPRSMDRAAAGAAYSPVALDVLKQFPIEPGEIALISLSENVTFRVTDLHDGASYVLRLHRPRYHTLDELNSERTWTRALAGAGIIVPEPVATRDGRDYLSVFVPGTGEHRHAGMARWIEGELLAGILEHTNDGFTLEGYFSQLGVIAASIHNQSSGWQPPATFARHSFDADGLMGDAPFWGPFWTHPTLSSAERRLLLDTRGRIRGALERYGQYPATYSLIHADLHPWNVLVEGERLIVIDFDDAGFGWHQYEAAVALYRYRSTPHFAAAERAFLAGYRSTRGMPGEAWALLPMFLLIRGMALIGWYLDRPEIERSQSMRDLIDSVCAQCATFEAPC